MTPGWWMDSGVSGPVVPEAEGPWTVVADPGRPGLGSGGASPASESADTSEGGPAAVETGGGADAMGRASPAEPSTGFGAIIDRIGAVAEGELPVGGRDALSGFLMAMGVGVIVMVLLTRLRRRARARAKTAVAEPAERIAEIRDDAAKRAKAEGSIAEVEAMARHFAAILDDKAMRLELLIEQADERLGKAGAIGDAPAATRASTAPTPPAEPAGAAADDGFAPTPSGDHGGVYELADEGMAPVAIAQKLGKPVGEVELILALRAS